MSVPGPKAAALLSEAPNETLAALGRVNYGSYILPQLRFRRRFWNLDYDLNTWSVNTDLTVNYFTDQTYTQPGDDGILVGWIAADDAARLFSPEHHGLVTGDAHAAIVDLALSELEQIYPRARDYLDDSLVVQWRHALPYFDPGYLRTVLPSLRRPFGRIALCGDYTEGPGMDAAVLSGLRAAAYVTEAIG